jgi:hypothetical protein
MSHDAVTRQKIALSRSPDLADSVMKVEVDRDSGEMIEARINPEALVLRLQHHFSEYVATLLSDDAARARFITRFDWASSP